MKNKNFISVSPVLIYCSLLVFLISGCAKRTVVPVINVSKIEAEHALAVAKSEIFEAREMGIDVSEAETLLEKAKKSISDGKYAEALKLAQDSRRKAIELKQRKLSGSRESDDASSAIERAERLISEAKSHGISISESENLLTDAVELFKNSNYAEAISIADKAAEIAEEALIHKKSEKYIVGSWEADRDCLWNIAKKKRFYNDPWKWKKIYLANKRKIEDPNIIYSGQLLYVPIE